MNAKPLTFMLSLTFLFLFSGLVSGEEPEVKKKYWDNGKLRSEKHYKNGKLEGLRTGWKKMDRKKASTIIKKGEWMVPGLNGMRTDRKSRKGITKREQ